MPTQNSRESFVRAHPTAVTIGLSLIGYVVVIGSFAGLVPVPELAEGTVLAFGHAIALINTLALLSLLAGWRFIKQDAVKKHQAAMMTAFALILLFLILYVWKQAGGFTKELVVAQGQFLADYATLVSYTYLAMLAIHVLLSIVAVPLVLYAVVLGLTHTPEELARTRHPQVGRVAVWIWSISLFLGIITYFVLNHVYTWSAV